jgi:hypothetical protein
MTNPDFTAKLRNSADPIERLTWHYKNPAAEAISLAAGGIPVVGITSNTVPWELIRAARAFPCAINSGNANHKDISSFMKEGVFEERIRAIFEKYYLDILNSMGFHDGLCPYCSLVAASTLAKDTERALEEAGLQVLPLAADMVDARNWDQKAMRQRVFEFLAHRFLARLS